MNATSISAATPPYANGVTSPSTRSTGKTSSVSVTFQAWNGPGFSPRLSNQFAMPGPDRSALRCRQPCMNTMKAIQILATSSARLIASDSPYTFASRCWLPGGRR